MRKSDTIRAEIAELEDELKELFDTAQFEQRDFNAMEKARVDEIQGIGGKNGLLQNAGAELERSIRFEARCDTLAGDFGKKFNPKPQHNIIRNSQGKEAYLLNKGDKLSAMVKQPETPYAFAEVIKAMVTGVNKHTPREIRAAMTEGSDSRGGVTVPNELFSEIIDLARAKSRVMEAGARMVTMTSSNMTIPILVGDPSFSLVGELATISLSDLTFTSGMLVAKKIAMRELLSRELVEDSEILAMFLTEKITKAFGTELDRLSLAGAASDTEIDGLLSNTRIASTGSIGEIDWSDLSAAARAIRVRNEEPTAAILHPEIHGRLLDTETGDGVNSSRGWLGKPPSLENVSMLDSTSCTSTKAIVGDFQQLLWGLRQGVLLEVTTQGSDAWEKHGVEIKATWRGDFGVMRADAFQTLTGITAS